MAVVKATYTWSGPHHDVLVLWVDDPSLGEWIATATDDERVAVLREADERDRETGRIAGVEIVGFLDFDRWESLPKLGLRWHVPGDEPLPLEDLLRRLQGELRQQTLAASQGR